jgi:hypothetical protein
VRGIKFPSIAGCLGSRQKSLDPFKKILTILNILEDISTLNASDDDVVQNTWSVKTG